MESRAASNSSAEERATARRCPQSVRTPPSFRLLSCLVLCTPFLSAVQTPYPAPHRPALSCSRPQAAPLTAHHLKSGTQGFHKTGFCGLGFFSFVCLQLLVLKPPTLRQLSQKESKREKRREKKYREDKMSFCKSRATTTGLCGVGPRPACPHRRQLVQGGTVGVCALHPRALLPVVTGEVGGV